jgi:hypothetical protein
MFHCQNHLQVVKKWLGASARFAGQAAIGLVQCLPDRCAGFVEVWRFDLFALTL